MHLGQTMIATATLVLAGAASPGLAQDYPNHVVTITIPYAPGGSAEGSLRPVADALSKTWKQPVIIESKGGGGTTIGAGYIAEQTPDGYRLLFTALSAHTIAPNMVRWPAAVTSPRAAPPIYMMMTAATTAASTPNKSPSKLCPLGSMYLSGLSPGIGKRVDGGGRRQILNHRIG